MKTKLFSILALAIGASLTLTSCNDLSNDNVLSFDGETQIAQTVPSISGTQQRIKVETAARTEATVSFNADALVAAYTAADCLNLENTTNAFTYTLDAIKAVEREVNGERSTVTLTRDIELYLKPVVPTKYNNYGYFAYPIRIRQYGSMTQYVTADKIKNYADALDFSDQYYLKGTIVSVGSVETDGYPITKYPVNPQYFYDRGAMPSYSDSQCPSNLSEDFVTVTLDVNGQQVKILVNDLARDNFLTEFASSLRTGSTVEVSLRRAKYDGTFGGLVNINPFAYFTL